MHKVAEGSGIMRPLLRGAFSPREYARLLRSLHAIDGAPWQRSLDVRDTARDYAERLARGDPWLLLAHAYVRYLGDLSGRQQLGELDAFKARARSELDRLPLFSELEAIRVGGARLPTAEPS